MKDRFGLPGAGFKPGCAVSLCLSLSLFTVGAQAVVIDFDSLSAGDPVNTLSGVTFSSNTGLQLIASDVFDAASGSNQLGVDDGGDEVFLPFWNDLVTLDFASPITSLSVSFVSTPGAPVGTYSIGTALGTAISVASPDAVLGDGGEVFRVTFTSLTPFALAELSGGGSGVHSFNIDDIEFLEAMAVPAPGTAGLLVLGLLAARSRKRL